MQIKKGDTVYVRTGQYKGKTGRVLHVDVKRQRILIEGVNNKKKHQRPTQNNPKGGIISMEAPVHLSNVALYSATLGGPTKISYRVTESEGVTRRVRVCRKTGEEI